MTSNSTFLNYLNNIENHLNSGSIRDSEVKRYFHYLVEIKNYMTQKKDSLLKEGIDVSFFILIFTSIETLKGTTTRTSESAEFIDLAMKTLRGADDLLDDAFGQLMDKRLGK